MRGLIRIGDIALHHCHIILVDHILAVGHLNDDISLSKRQVLGFVDTQVVEGIDESSVILRHTGSTLILCGSHPVLCAILGIFLGNSLEVTATHHSIVHTVGLGLGFFVVLALYIDGTILYRVGKGVLGNDLDDVERIVNRALHRTEHATHCHGVEA